MIDFDFFKRIIAWLAAINAVLVVLIAQLTPFATDYPVLANVMQVIVTISAIITPFLPRAQGTSNAGR